MLELVMLVCNVVNPTNCKNVPLIYGDESRSPYQCIMQAMPEMAKWAGQNPQWRVAKWTCRRAGRYAKA